MARHKDGNIALGTKVESLFTRNNELTKTFEAGIGTIEKTRADLMKSNEEKFKKADIVRDEISASQK